MAIKVILCVSSSDRVVFCIEAVEFSFEVLSLKSEYERQNMIHCRNLNFHGEKIIKLFLSFISVVGSLTNDLSNAIIFHKKKI
jgi:hypothetical protein